MKIGAQLYTVRDFCQTEGDLACSLEKIAKMGYTTVQVSGIEKIDPLRLRELCDENGLSIVLTHNDPNRIINDTDRLIEEHNILGCDYIGLGAMPPKYQNFFWGAFRTGFSGAGEKNRRGRQTADVPQPQFLNLRRDPTGGG